MNWDDMKVFLAITATGGLKKAAQKLGVHHTSVARRIKIFEGDLGVKLFDRLPGGYALTQAGESLQQSAQLIRQEFNTIESNLLGKDLRLEGDICLTVPHGFALHLLMPDLQEFMTCYPGVNLKVDMRYTMSDLANREADVAIRLVNEPADSLAGRCVGEVHWSAYASTAYLKTHDLTNNPEDCHWLGWGKADNHLNWAQKALFPSVPVRSDMYSDVLQLAALQQHAGIASLPCYIGDQAEGIERITSAAPIAKDSVWILSHKDMASNARVRALTDFLYRALMQKQHLLEGRSAGAK